MPLSDAALLDRVAVMDGALCPAPPVDTRALADAALADLRALTVWQYWASAIVGRPGGSGGPKDVENRSRDVSRRGLVLIHAARPEALDRGAVDRCAPLRHWLKSEACPDEWVFSAIIGAAVITGCHTCDGSCSPWAEPGVWHVELGRRFAFESPVPASGALGFWRVTGTVRDAVLQQLRVVAA